MNSSNRLEKNLEILDKLSQYLKQNPSIRFGQALSNLKLATHRDEGVRHLDIFFEEPEETLIKMRDL